MKNLLSTKLYIPQTRINLVSRPNLVEKLNTGLHRKLTLISAPAGFGKTTLVSEWVEKVRLVNESEKLITWLSLDEDDNDPARFLSYLIASLNNLEGSALKIGDGAQKMLQSSQPPPIETIIASIINEIAEISGKIIYILDDYHLISSSPVDNALSYLLDHLPPQLHMVILTRDDPQLPIARLRVKNQLNELRATDLRFTSSEAAEFLNQVMGLDLSNEDIDALESRTEGWVAGLQLAAISLQGQEDIGKFIKSFTGSHRLVLDYLIEEVLEQQSESTQTFLQQTAVLNRLTGSLCDALTGQQNGQKTLEMLERSNLFVVPLDNERCWYRYHHLFADLLHSRLRQQHPEKIPGLHEKASLWFEENQYIDEAVEHSILAENLEHAALLIEENSPIWFQRGEHTKLRKRLSILPEQMVLAKPFLHLIHAAVLVSGGRLDDGERLLQIIEGRLEGKPDASSADYSDVKELLPEDERKRLIGFAGLIRSFLTFYQGDLDGAIRFANRVLKTTPDDDIDWRWSAVLVLGDAYAIKGDMPSAYKRQSEALELSKKRADTHMILVTSLRLAAILRMQGKLQEIQSICYQEMKRAVESGFSELNIGGWLLTIWGETLTEMNQLEEGYQKTKEGIKLAGQTTDVNILGLSNLNYIRVLYSTGDYAAAEEVIKKLEDIHLISNIPYWLFNQISSWKARIWLKQDKLNAVSKWVEKRWIDPSVLPLDLHEMEQILIVRFLLAKERFDEASKMLVDLLKSAESGGRKSRVIEIMLLQAFSLQAQGDIAQAMTKLEQALLLAELDGYIRTFVDEGPAMEALLKRMKVDDERLKEYVQKLLVAFRDQESKSSASSPQPLIEPLSERELEVLRLIAEGLTNQKIATRLYLSLHTIKVHASNIYSKLGVHSRAEAGAKARELGILDSD